jgi:gamma-glutamyltranspeptidase / glutathione hydrolase
MAVPEHLTQNWEIRKPGISSKRGIVVSQSDTAAKVGAEILSEGGTAVDAAVAAALALAAVEPWNNGLGAVGFMVVHRAGADHAEAVDFGPVAPHQFDPTAFPLTGASKTELFTWPQVEGDRNIHGPLSFAIPSAVRGYAMAVERFGRLPWRELLAPAITLAKEGLPVDWYVTLRIAAFAADLRRYAESRKIYLPDDLPPAVPAIGPAPVLSLGRLADTMTRLAEAGPEDFYTGDIAAAIAADTEAAGGVLSTEDLARCQPRIVPSLDIPYRGYTFQAARGLTAAPTLADVLDRLEGKSFGKRPDANYFEAIAEALQQAYAARLDGLGDTEPPAESCTTHITAVDREGGIAALTTTLLSTFGSRYVLPRTGVLMNNGVMWFDPTPGRPNSIGPSKRALTNMCPLVVARDGRPRFGIGASGGRRILGAVLQMASFVVDFGMSAGEAAHHPRIDVSGAEGVALDRNLPEAVLDRLEGRGGVRLVEHTVSPQQFACPNLILRGEDGVNHGISDVMSPWSAAVAEPEPVR